MRGVFAPCEVLSPTKSATAIEESNACAIPVAGDLKVPFDRDRVFEYNASMRIVARILVLLYPLLVESVWAVDDAETNTAETSTQCPENGEYRAESQAEVDALAENYPECEQLISLKIAPPIYVALFGYDPIDPVVSPAAFQRIRGVGNAF